jgi:serine/threonine-protein kinase
MDAASLVGTTLGPYQVHELIGRGAFSLVYRAEDVVWRRPVALKVLAVPDSERPDQLQEESRCLERCRSPHVVTTDGTGRIGDLEFLVLELMHGTVEARLSQAPLSHHEVITIGTAILSGLDVAHRRGVLHCDIKPSNIGIAPDGVIKLLDFGIAWPLPGTPGDGLTVRQPRRGLVGTPHYMPPEQLCGRMLDERTDIYSTGAVLYELMTGRQPFTAHSLLALIETVQQGRLTPPSFLNPGIHPGLEGVVMSAMARSPDDRYPSARAMRDALLGISRAPRLHLARLCLGQHTEAAAS